MRFAAPSDSGAMSVSGVELVVAVPQQRIVFENLMQLYTHDFSEHWHDRPIGEVDERGRFPEYALDPYWREPEHIPLLLRVDSNIVGFALLNQVTHTNCPLDRNMAEFFILRKHRRRGLGMAAAHAIFERYPGTWEVAVARRNLAALTFWRTVIGEHPLLHRVEEVDISTPAWDGPVLRFRSASESR